MKFKPFQVYEPESRYKDDCLVVMQEFDNDYFYKDQIEKFVSKDILMRMLYSVYNPKSPDYVIHKSKGIQVFKEWSDPKTGIENFHKWFISNNEYDINSLYKLRLGRYDFDKDFCPDNCYLFLI